MQENRPQNSDDFEHNEDDELMLDYTSSGVCPVCGRETYNAHTGGMCNAFRQYCPDEDCGWCSVELYDC